MKKIIYTLLVVLMAFAFMGCPTTYADYEVADEEDDEE